MQIPTIGVSGQTICRRLVNAFTEYNEVVFEIDNSQMGTKLMKYMHQINKTEVFRATGHAIFLPDRIHHTIEVHHDFELANDFPSSPRIDI